MKNFFLFIATFFFMAFANAQNVGIGTTSPQARLHVSSDLEAVRLSGSQPFLSFFNDTTYKGYVWNKNTSDMEFGTALGNIGGNVYLSVVGNQVLTVSNNANVGINNIYPQAKLHITGDQEAVRISGNQPFLSFYNSTTYKGYVWNKGTNDMEFGTAANNTAGNLYLSVHGTQGITVQNDAKVGIGTTAPQAKLHVVADNEALRISGSQPFLTLYNGSAYKGYLWSKGANDIELGTATGNTAGNVYIRNQGRPGITVQNDGRVVIGELAYNNEILYAYGGIILINTDFGLGNGDTWNITPSGSALNFKKNNGYTSYIEDDGSYHQNSDKRLKESFKSYKPVLKDIQGLKVLTYHYKASKLPRRSFGLIAQNVQEHFPEIVSASPGKDGVNYLGIDYSKIGVLAVKAIQEQQVIIEAQATKIGELEKRLAAIEKVLVQQKHSTGRD